MYILENLIKAEHVAEDHGVYPEFTKTYQKYRECMGVENAIYSAFMSLDQNLYQKYLNRLKLIDIK